MRYISVGDVVGYQGIEFLKKQLPKLIEENDIDFVIVNIENIADGLGVDDASYSKMLEIENIDCFVLGNHTWDKSEVKKHITEKKVVRPYNYGNMPGSGIRYFKKNNNDIFVIQLMGEVNINKKLENPFTSFDKALDEIDEYIEKNNKFKNLNEEGYINKEKTIVLLDFHADATSEVIMMGYYADGRASSILSTHTHVQTADERILPKGSAYITDIGMTGPYESVIGMDIEVAFNRFIKHTKSKYNVSTSKSNILCAVVIDIDDITKKARDIKRIRIVENE